jgi:SecY interacting protein Syd
VTSKIQTSLSRLYDNAFHTLGEDCLSSEFDADWKSPCETYQSADRTFWRPAIQTEPVDFSGLANAVGEPIHPDICAFYGSFWAGCLEATSAEGHVSLIQLWNGEDFERLVANLIGHYMAKKRINQPYTVFFANTEPDSEFFLSIDNKTGKILLEEAGKPPAREVETDIATFLNRLTPVQQDPGIY